MMSKKITLTLNPKFHAILIQKADERAQSVQEYINETLRDRVFAPPTPKSKAGRPKKVDDAFIEHFTRSR